MDRGLREGARRNFDGQDKTPKATTIYGDVVKVIRRILSQPSLIVNFPRGEGPTGWGGDKSVHGAELVVGVGSLGP